jgi:hypothetical protein
MQETEMGEYEEGPRNREPKGYEWSARSAGSFDAALFDRALGILHRMATERTGWRRFFARWYFSDEPLRNDAANLVREAGFGMMMPLDSRLVGDPD